jgi:hypothetical protein
MLSLSNKKRERQQTVPAFVQLTAQAPDFTRPPRAAAAASDIFVFGEHRPPRQYFADCAHNPLPDVQKIWLRLSPSAVL